MSMINKTLVSISAIALTLSLSTLALAQNASIGVNAAVKGDVTITTAEQAAKQAVVKDEVFLGQLINSEKLSSLQVMLKDKTVFTVGPECELTIDKFVYDPSKQNNAMVASVSKGMFRFMSGNISKSGANAVSVNTPTSSMGIRGTMVEGIIGEKAINIAIAAGVLPQGTAVDANGATLYVLRGPGPNTSGANRKGEITVTSGKHTVLVKGSGQAVFIPSAGALPIVFTLSPMAFQNFSQNLRTTPTGPATYSPFEMDSHFSPRSQMIQPKTSIGAGVGTKTIALGIAAIGGVGVIVVTADDDDVPVSP